MSIPPEPLRPRTQPLYVTKVITVFALIFGIAFGICSVSGISLSRGGNARTAHLLIVTAVVMGAVCVVCLAGVGLFVVIRSRRP